MKKAIYMYMYLWLRINGTNFIYMYMYMENDILNELAQRKQHTAQRVEPHKLTNIKKSTMTYLEWWLDANLHLVLFIQYIYT